MTITIYREANGVCLQLVLTTKDTQSHSRLSDFIREQPIQYQLLSQDIANGLETLAKAVGDTTNAKG